MSDLASKSVDFEFLFDATRRLNRALDLEPLLGEVRDLCAQAVDAEAVNLVIWNEEKNRLEFQLAYNEVDAEVQGISIAPGEGLIGWVAENNQSALVNELHWDLRYSRKLDQRFRFVARSVLAVPFHRGRSVMGVVEVLNKRGIHGFDDSDLSILGALAEPISVALENALLVRGLHREKMENEVFFQIGARLNQTLDPGETLTLILDLLTEVLPFDAAGIALVRGNPPEIDVVEYRGYTPEHEGLFSLKVGQGAIGWVIETGEPLRIQDVSRDRRYVNARPETCSELAVPLVSEGEVLGAYNLESNALDAYRPRDVRRLVTLANQAAIAVQRARLHQEVLRRQRLQDEVEIARGIQERLLPDSDPDLPGFEVSGRTTPSLEVGGDSYDVIPITRGQLGLMVGDVAGKGIPAAFILALFLAALRSEVGHNYEIRRTIRNVNRLLEDSTQPDQFVTAFYGVLDQYDRAFTYVNAGHNPPILLRRDGGIDRLEEGGLVLGVLEDAVYHQTRVDLEEGDLVLFYTDGAIEATDAAGEEFGESRLIDRLQECRNEPASEIRVALEEAILRHCNGKAQDDVTLLILKVGPDAAMASRSPGD